MSPPSVSITLTFLLLLVTKEHILPLGSAVYINISAYINKNNVHGVLNGDRQQRLNAVEESQRKTPDSISIGGDKSKRPMQLLRHIHIYTIPDITTSRETSTTTTSVTYHNIIAANPPIRDNSVAWLETELYQRAPSRPSSISRRPAYKNM